MKRKSLLLVLVSIVAMLSMSSCCCMDEFFGPDMHGHGGGGPGYGGGGPGYGGGPHYHAFVVQPESQSDITVTNLPE
jgi:hypothetical protein